MEATRKQMMAIALARQVEDGKAYIVGTGLPLVILLSFCPSVKVFRGGVFLSFTPLPIL